MSEKEKKALETIAKALPQMSDFQKGRLFGMAEAMEEQNTKKRGENDGRNDNTGDSHPD